MTCKDPMTAASPVDYVSALRPPRESVRCVFCYSLPANYTRVFICVLWLWVPPPSIAQACLYSASEFRKEAGVP